MERLPAQLGSDQRRVEGGAGELPRPGRGVDGHSNKALAAALGIAHQTAKNHVRHVMAKLRVTSRVQLVAWALERGYVPTQTAATA